MAKEEKVIITWICDRCAKAVDQKEMPSSASDPWGKLMIDQPSGFDHGGAPWAPRMRNPLILCGACIDAVVAVLNLKSIDPKPLTKKHKCRYINPWAGPCGVKCSDGQEFCSEHLNEKCRCGKQATHGCDNAGSLVCGAPLCDNCRCHH